MSQVKLNLGAGLFPLPFVRDAEPNREHGLPFPDECYEPGWINVDKFPHEGIDEQIDLFRFPWVRSSNGNPFNDNSVDFIFCSHFLEHVPHEVRLRRGLPVNVGRYTDQVDEDGVFKLDGFFVFFNEVWRVLKPGGLIHLRMPFGVSYDALCDPTHTRRIVPGSFSYLTDTTDEQPFDYMVPCRFEMVGEILWRMTKRLASELEDYTVKGVDNIIRTRNMEITAFDLTLEAIKQ